MRFSMTKGNGLSGSIAFCAGLSLFDIDGTFCSSSLHPLSLLTIKLYSPFLRTICICQMICENVLMVGKRISSLVFFLGYMVFTLGTNLVKQNFVIQRHSLQNLFWHIWF